MWRLHKCVPDSFSYNKMDQQINEEIDQKYVNILVNKYYEKIEQKVFFLSLLNSTLDDVCYFKEYLSTC